MRPLRQLAAAVPAALSAPPVRRAQPVSTAAALQRRVGNEGMRAVAEMRQSPAALATALVAQTTATSAPTTALAQTAAAPTETKAPVRTAEARAAVPAASRAAPGAVARPGEVAAEPKADGEAADVRAADVARLEALKEQVGQTAQRQRKPAKSSALVARTRSSAKNRNSEGRLRASEATIRKLDEAKQQTERIDKAIAQIKQALRDKMLKAMPDSKSGEEAKKAVSPETRNEVAGEVKGELATAQAKTVGDLPNATEQRENPADHAPGEPPSLTATPPGARPPAPSASGAVPDRLPDAALDTQPDRQEADAQLASEDLTQDRLKRSNEPSFVDAASTRDQAEKHSEAGPPEVRKVEQEVRSEAQTSAGNALGQGISGMFGSREAGFLRVFGQQNAAKAKQEAERARIAQDLENIQRKTSTDVKALLDYMDAGADMKFSFGLLTARWAFENQMVKTEEIIRKINRDDAISSGSFFGVLSASWGDLSAEDAERVINWGRKAYQKEIERVIDDVANFVGPILARIEQRIAQGKKEAADYIARLDPAMAEIGVEELDRINGEFDTLSSQVEQRRDALITKLSASYEASKKAIEERAQAFRDANKAWWQKLKEKVRGVIRAIVQIKDMFATILSRVAGVVGAILRDPGGFLGNLVAGVKRGLGNFVDRFPTHLKEGFFEWLFGTAAKAGVQVPKKFDPPGIFGLLASILGLTVANVRARAVTKVGEGPVSALEKGAGVLMVLKEKGLPGLWEMLAEKLESLKESVIEQVKSMLLVEVIKAGVTWIIGLLNPVAGFIKACKAIYEIVKFFVNNWDRIVEFVNSVLDSIGAIAKGKLDEAAALVENTLKRTIPIIIGFLAGLLGLGNIADKVKKIIDRLQAPVNKAIDWVIDKAVGLVKKGAGLAAKAAKGIFNWARAKVGFKDAEGKSHTIFIATGTAPGLSIASDPMPAHQFLKMYVARKAKENKKFETENAAEIKAVESAIKVSQGIIDEIAKLKRDTSKDPSAKELEALERLLNANVKLSQALSDLVGRDSSIAANIHEKYMLEGVTGTYESIPKPKGDQLTADHQPQAAVLEACATFDYFDPSGNLHERAAKRAAKGFAINLHLKRHVAGRTFGGKGKGTKEAFLKLAAKVKAKKKKEQPKAVVDLIRAELKADYVKMMEVVEDKKNYTDITEDKAASKLTDPEKDKLIEGIRSRIKAGQREVLAQDLDSLVE